MVAGHKTKTAMTTQENNLFEIETGIKYDGKTSRKLNPLNFKLLRTMTALEKGQSFYISATEFETKPNVINPAVYLLQRRMNSDKRIPESNQYVFRAKKNYDANHNIIGVRVWRLN